MRDVVSGLLANPISSLLSRAGRATKRWLVEKLPTHAALQESQRQCNNLRSALRDAIRDLEIVCDHVLQFDPSSADFNAQRVLVDVHTKRLFKAPMPRILHSTRQTNTLHVSYGRDRGVIAGMTICVSSRLGGYSERHVLQQKDIGSDHLCFRPTNLDLAKTEVEDLIVSFVPAGNLNEFENAVALVLDVARSAIDKCRDVLDEPLPEG